MAFFKLHAYDADLFLPDFLGVRQNDESMNADIRFAEEEQNLETIRGTLQPAPEHDILPGGLPSRIETLAFFYRRWFTNNGSKSWFVAAAGGKLYYRQEGTLSSDWFQIPMPTGIESFQSNVWSWVTYELNPQASEAPIDVLLISNAQDGMFMITPPANKNNWGYLKTKTWQQEKAETWGDAMSDDWDIETVDTNGKKFGIIERYAERIWGGAIPDDPDMLMYSAPYDPTEWDADPDIPEDGAGDILQPSWDGDEFTSLKSFGDQLLAFKKNRVWRITGTNPGEYAFREQFGGGTAFPNTICKDIERLFLVEADGTSVYDGMSVSPFQRSEVRNIWRTLNRQAIEQMCAAVHNRKYYVAFPTGTSTVNNALLVYNFDEGTILYYTDVYIESFLHTLDSLYATTSTAPGYVMKINEDSWTLGRASGAKSKWVTPWMDFGYKSIKKGGFDIYFLPEVQTEPVMLDISIETEKKIKTKQYLIEPRLDEHRMKRMHFGGAGRKFRIIIETKQGVKDPWRIVGGLHLIVETDPD